MTRFVLDASISLAWFLDDPVPEFALRTRRDLHNGAIASVPALWYLEMANGFALAERRNAMTAAFADRCLDDIEGLMGSVIQNSPATVSFREAMATARAFKLTAYDAAYLETARKEHLPLATLDRALGQAAKQAGVSILR